MNFKSQTVKCFSVTRS